MGWPVCNNTEEFEKVEETPVFHGLTFHQLGLILSAASGLIAVLVSFYLIMMHATHYLRPWEQRHIIRILFMVPVYATVSFLSYLFYREAIYFEVLRDCYEAFAIASFFALICHYIAEDLHQQKNYFRTVKPRNWVWPISSFQKCGGGENGMWRKPRSGLTWFNIIWVGVFQYCFIRVFFTCVAVATQAFNLYCESSLNPAFAHIWVMGFEAIAVTIAMYCIIQFYLQLKEDIAPHKPLLKVSAIKLVIFLSFWQTIMISFLTSAGVIKAGPKFGTPDINIGIPAMLLCLEMAIFAVFHLWAFSWLPYRLTSKHNMAESVPGYNLTNNDYKGGFLGIKALMDAFNPWDLVKAVGRSARWLFVGRKTRTLDPSYNTNKPEDGPNGNDTSYRPGGKSDRFGDEEGEELLMHAQSAPASGPPPAYSHEAVEYDREIDPGDIGIARSAFGDEDSLNNKSRSHSPMPYPPPPAMPTSGKLSMPTPQEYNPESRSQDYRDASPGYSRQQPQYDPYQSYSGRPGGRPEPTSSTPYPEPYGGVGQQNTVRMPDPQGQHPATRRDGSF